MNPRVVLPAKLAANHSVLVFYDLAWKELCVLSAEYGLKGRTTGNDWSAQVIELAHAFKLADEGSFPATNLLAHQCLSRIEQLGWITFPDDKRQAGINYFATKLQGAAKQAADKRDASTQA